MLPELEDKQPVSGTPSHTSLPTEDPENDQQKAFTPVKSYAESQKSARNRGRSQSGYSGSQQRSRSYGDGHGFTCISHEDFDNHVTDNQSEKDQNFEVAWQGDDDAMNPRNMKKARRWLIVVIVSMGSTCV